MLYLSRDDLELIGELVMWDYEEQIGHYLYAPIDIEGFARDYLGLSIKRERLSKNGGILGLTTSEGIFIELEFKDESKVLSLPKDSLLLDEGLHRNKRRERFTIAHECAHQVLARIEDDPMGVGFREKRSGNDAPRRLKTKEDWTEWQANALAAILLMPRIDLAHHLAEYQLLNGFPGFRNFTRDKDSLTPANPHMTNEHLIAYLTDTFEVSKLAMRIRLQEIGFLAKA